VSQVKLSATLHLPRVFSAFIADFLSFLRVTHPWFPDFLPPPLLGVVNRRGIWWEGWKRNEEIECMVDHLYSFALSREMCCLPTYLPTSSLPAWSLLTGLRIPPLFGPTMILRKEGRTYRRKKSDPRSMSLRLLFFFLSSSMLHACSSFSTVCCRPSASASMA